MIRTRLAVWNAMALAFVLTLIGTIAYVSLRRSLYAPIDARLSGWMAQFSRDIGRDWERFPPKPDGLMPGRGIRRGPRPPGGGPRGFGPEGPPMGRGPRPGGPPMVGGPNGPPQPPEGPMPDPARGVSPDQARRMKFEWFVSRPRVITASGKGLMFSADQPWDEEAMRQSLKGQWQYSIVTVLDERIRVLSVPVYHEGNIVGVAQAAAPLQNTDELMAKQAKTLLALLPLALLLTSLTGIYLTRVALKPVQQIADAAERIEATSLSGRLPVQGKDEFAHLSTTMNSMLARLESSFQRLGEAYEAQRRFISDASHELKTPLTAIKTRTGIAKRGPQTAERYKEHLDAIEVSADSMTAIVRDLLLLAKSDEGKLELRKSPTPLVAIADEAAAQVRAPGRARLEIDVPPELDVCVDPDLFGRVLVNLLGNALRHTPHEGLVHVAARTEASKVVIEVTDNGEGIPRDHLAHLFERFHRVDASRDKESGGTGLGLPIAKSVVEAHGGTISLESQVGKGTTVRIVLPA